MSVFPDGPLAQSTGVEREWSKQQAAIFDWFKSGKGHLIVRARAGTGKTTTILKAIDFAPEQGILLCAFNKRIADEMSTRLRNPNAQAKTLHSVGFAAVRRYWPGVKVGYGSERADALSLEVCGATVPETIRRLVSKLHSKGREIAPHATGLGGLTEIAEVHECEPDTQWEMCPTCKAPSRAACHVGQVDPSKHHTYGGFDLEYVEGKALEAMELAATVVPGITGIDFSDMIYLPVRNRWLRPTYDMVVVDEAQDMTTAQLEIAQGVCAGRIAVVGDDRQAIYAFRGADTRSLDRLKRSLNATELGLTTTYRCGKAIVARAARLVPDFNAADSAPDGVERWIDADHLIAELRHGDFLLSRVNAPLVGIAMRLLQSGKRARIAGRDIGAGLKGLIARMKARSIPELLERVAGWADRETKRLIAAGRRQAQIDGVRDQEEMLVALATTAKSVQDVTARIDALFTDDGLGQAGVVTCSSVHKAKGLEAERVLILESTLAPVGQREEEDNIRYVAVTRAKRELVWVQEVR